MNGRPYVLTYKGQTELERDICHIIPKLMFPCFGPVPENYAFRENLVELIYSAQHNVAAHFLTEKGKQWIVDHAPKIPDKPVERQVFCVYCRTQRKAIDKEGHSTQCKGCGASEVMV